MCLRVSGLSGNGCLSGVLRGWMDGAGLSVRRFGSRQETQRPDQPPLVMDTGMELGVQVESSILLPLALAFWETTDCAKRGGSLLNNCLASSPPNPWHLPAHCFLPDTSYRELAAFPESYSGPSLLINTPHSSAWFPQQSQVPFPPSALSSRTQMWSSGQ